MIDEWRASFDAEVTFANGGGLRAEGFRLDLPGADPTAITDDELGALFVRHLGLLMVDRVTIRNRTSLREAHKGSRGTGGAASPTDATTIVELSHVITAGMTTYPGLPGPEIGDHLSREASRDVYEEGTQFQIGWIRMVANTGTYLDTPSHRYADGVDLAGMPLSSMVDLDGLVVRVPAGVTAIDRLMLVPYDVAGKAVILHTGWDRHWGTDAYGGGGHPHLTEDGAEWLVSQGAALVGIDSVNIDATAGRSRPAHSTLLAARIPIVEHLCGLEALPPHGFRFHAAPPMVAGMGTFPVRAYALVRSTASTSDVSAHSDSGAPSRQP